MREAERCPICGTKSNWVTDVHCYCIKCLMEFDPETQIIYEVSRGGALSETKPEPQESIKTKIKIQRQTIKITPTAIKYYAYGLKYWRLRQNLSLQELGEKIGRSYSTICNWEVGKRPIKRQDLITLSNVLRVSIEKLLTKYSQDKIDVANINFQLTHRVDTNKSPSNILQELRFASGLTKTELARRLKRSDSYVNLYEKDPSKILKYKIEDQQKIADALDIDVEELIFEIRKEMEK